ncbi:MAG: ParA family protein [Kofleriaceae bacterium]
MKTVSIVSAKGGVGKTTLSLNLAFALARRSWRTLVVDADPQGAIGHSLHKKTPSAGLAGYLAGRASLDAAIVTTRLPELAILPIGPIAIQDSQAFAEHLADGKAFAALAAAAAPRFDVMLVDTPCGFAGVTMGALRASDFALAPLQAEPIALRAMTQLLDVLAALRGEQRKVKLAGVVLTMLQLRNKESLSVAQETWAKLPPEMVLETNIPRDQIFLEASAVGVPVGLLRQTPPPVASLFDRVAVELEPRIELTTPSRDDGPVWLLA